jgi:hypothetical protein
VILAINLEETAREIPGIILDLLRGDLRSLNRIGH